MTKTQQIVEHIAVTFVEAAGAYLIVIPTVNWSKAVIAGAIGAGFSAAYNVLRQSEPTLPNTPVEVAPLLTPVVTPTVSPPLDTPTANPNSINS